ncbi:hypothetical protein BVC80_1807g31 [Macleaya cordata]|uniref:Uncharacterized protein n=1 Tax=Macleaya cordata TaxID=56857 RepID=A0A200PXW2_MACCD|nr:hypothetical protein BVC80_1807g31 [Macleaya cordata]
MESEDLHTDHIGDKEETTKAFITFVESSYDLLEDLYTDFEDLQATKGSSKENIELMAMAASVDHEKDIQAESNDLRSDSEDDVDPTELFSRILENSKSLSKANKELKLENSSLMTEKNDLTLQVEEASKRKAEDKEILEGKDKEIKFLKNELVVTNERVTSLLEEIQKMKDELKESKEMLILEGTRLSISLDSFS